MVTFGAEGLCVETWTSEEGDHTYCKVLNVVLGKDGGVYLD